MLGLSFFPQTNFDFSISHFCWNFISTSFKSYCCPKLKFEKKISSFFSNNYGGLKIAILASLANLGQLTRDIFRAINA